MLNTIPLNIQMKTPLAQPCGDLWWIKDHFQVCGLLGCNRVQNREFIPTWCIHTLGSSTQRQPCSAKTTWCHKWEGSNLNSNQDGNPTLHRMLSPEITCPLHDTHTTVLLSMGFPSTSTIRQSQTGLLHCKLATYLTIRQTKASIPHIINFWAVRYHSQHKWRCRGCK
jgi:hypothetical protein